MDYHPDLQFNSIGYHEGASVALHQHIQCECIIPEHGPCQLQCAGKDYDLKGGTCLFIPPHVMHDQVKNHAATSYYIKISGMEALFGAEPCTLQMDPEGMLLQWCRDLSRCMQDGLEPTGLVVSSLVTAWVHRLASINNAQRHRHRDPAVLRAIAFMQDHYDQDLGVVDISSHVGLSASHLGALFRQHEGQSLMHSLRAIRMRHARRLLMDDYHSVAEIGARVGYADPNYFARQFRSVHGLSPRAWRQQQYQTA